MGRRRVCTAVWSLFVATCLACNASKPIQAPTPIPVPAASPTPVPTPTVSRVTIGGNNQLTEIGATAQLTATALYADASTQDVTQEARWSSLDPGVVSVSAGLVRAVSFGQTSVSATYLNRANNITVKATPAGTFIVVGGVREPGHGPMANVEVIETLSGRSMTTSSSGGFMFAAIATPTVRFAIRQDSYEAIDIQTSSNAVGFLDVPIQKIVRFGPGEKVTPSPLAENDVTYTVGTAKCDPCRLMRFVTPGAGTASFNITWQGSRRLTFFAGDHVIESGTPLAAEIPFEDAGEHILYFGSTAPGGSGSVGGPSSRITFTIETTMR
jgi:hypothetical protein